MRTPVGMVRKVMYLMFTLMISVALAACGGGGGGTTSSGGPASASVSVASALDYPAETPIAAATAAPAGTSAPPDSTPLFDHVWVTVTKVALISSSGPEFPDRNGEIETEDADGEVGQSGMPGFVTAVLPHPVVFDLLHPPTGGQVAKLLNRFPEIPAGEYSKIRVYYDNVVGVKGDNTVTFHPTAHYHFDVHFVGGNLIVPVATNPDGGIRFYEIRIQVVGLKIHEAGNSGNVLLRPQVFAKVVGAPKYIVTGIADQVNHSDRTFVVKAVNDNISASYGSGTSWFYVDGRYVGPFGISGADALQNTALVDVIGTFQGGVLVAEEVDITFPSVRQGTADNVWILDNTAFIVRSVADNVVVIPKPDRASAYYDNSALPYLPLPYTAIANNIPVKTRGYFDVAGDLEAYWITVGP